MRYRPGAVRHRLERFPGLLAPVRCAWQSPTLLWELTKREVAARYRGSALGFLWPFLTSLLLLLTFTFVFGTVFQARWDRPLGNRVEFGLLLFSGLALFWFYSDCLGRAPGLVLENVSYVKKVVFPLEVLPWAVMGGALFHLVVNFAVLLTVYAVLVGVPGRTVVLLPVVLLPFVMLTMGLAWILAALGVYLRDVGQFVGFALTASLFLSTIFYPLSAVPDPVGLLIFLNPLSFAVDQVRAVAFWNESPDWPLLGAYAGCSWVTAWLGFYFFSRARRGFADVV